MAGRYDPNELSIYGARDNKEMDAIVAELDRALQGDNDTVRLNTLRAADPTPALALGGASSIRL